MMDDDAIRGILAGLIIFAFAGFFIFTLNTLGIIDIYVKDTSYNYEEQCRALCKQINTEYVFQSTGESYNLKDIEMCLCKEGEK